MTPEEFNEAYNKANYFDKFWKNYRDDDEFATKVHGGYILTRIESKYSGREGVSVAINEIFIPYDNTNYTVKYIPTKQTYDHGWVSSNCS
jgi:hypothetical protein